MTDAAANLKHLPDLCGELPAASEPGLTCLVCVSDLSIGDTLEQDLAALYARFPVPRIHVHVPGASEKTRARLALLSAALADFKLSMTYEQATESAPPDSLIGLVRLFQLTGIAPGQYVYMAGAFLTAQSPPPIEIGATLDQHPALVETKPSLQIATDGSDKALRFLAAIAAPLIERLRDKTHSSTDSASVLSQVALAAQNKAPGVIGAFPAPKDQPIEKSNINSPSIWPHNEGLKVLLLKPDLALPFKSPPLVSDPVRRREGSPFLTGADGALRMAWQECFDHLEQALQNRGHSPVILERPGAEINATVANQSGADLVILPHRQHFQCPGLAIPALFLMQLAHRWLFTLDHQGWGAGSSAYPYDEFHDSPADSGVYENYATRLRTTNESKFDQPDRRSRQDLVAGGVIPEGDYLFFPCQIPDDEVVRFFCDPSEHKVIAALSAWANNQRVTLVLKAHPAAPKTADAFRSVAAGPFVQWADASVHDLIEHCQAVYTLNSGVGHEALLHNKPVVMFGRSEYDRLAIRITLDDLDDAYARVRGWNSDHALRDTQQFYHWFTRDMAIDLSDHNQLNTAMMRCVDQIERLKSES